jgi:hypothetical protein
MMETRRNLFKTLTIGALTLLATSKRALSSYFSDMLTTSFAGDTNAGSSEVADFYVASNGKDSNPGTAMAPFATLARARNAVRKKISNGLTHNILVLIRGGTYGQTETLTFGPEDSGTEKYSITYAASSGEEVVLSGGEKIAGWRKGPSAIWTTEVPAVKAGQWYFRQLFVNGKRATRARTPNADDRTPWWSIKTSPATMESAPAENVPIPITLTAPIQAYNNPGDVELVYIANNEEGRKRLASINEKDQSLTLAPPNRWNSRKFVNDWWLCLPAAGKSCFLENALELLDQPGEWYLDRQTGVLSYWPREGEDLTRDEVTAPVLQKTMLAVVGTQERPVVNVHFRGIHAQYVDWPLPPWGYMPLFCCNLQSGIESQPGHRPMDAAVEFEFARSCNFTDGGIAHVGGMGLCLRDGTAHNHIEGNEIFDLGGGGLAAGYTNTAAGYFYAAPPPAQDEYKGYRIANNYVHHCGMDYYGAVGILLFATRDTVVSHNLIHDTTYFGIGVAGSQDPKAPFAQNNVIEYNHIFDAMKVTIDGAGLYVTFAQLDQGCFVRGNLIHDTQGNRFATQGSYGNHSFGEHPPSAGIYLDGYSSGGHYENNVLYRNFAAGPLIFDYKNAKQTNSWLDNLFQKDGSPPEEFIEALQASAGLEPAYQGSIRKMEPNPCQRSILIDPKTQGSLAAYQFDLSKKGRGVVEIVRPPEGIGDGVTLKFLGLQASADYSLKGYASPLVPSEVWGPPDPDKPASMPMLSNVISVLLADIGLALDESEAKVSGRKLMEQGLSINAVKSPQVIWIAYQRLNSR